MSLRNTCGSLAIEILNVLNNIWFDIFVNSANGDEVDVTDPDPVDPQAGTTYAIYPPAAVGNVVTVSPEGLVTAVAEGVATIVASNPDGVAGAACSDSIQVRVLPEPSSGLLLASGIAALFALSRSRRRASQRA